jgi:hypothetical protein
VTTGGEFLEWMDEYDATAWAGIWEFRIEMPSYL